MYGKARLAFVLAATLLAAPAFGQSFVGEWTATATTPGGEVSEALSVVKTAGGYAVTAKLIGAAEGTPTAGPGTDVVLDGDRFSYKRTISTPDGDVVLTMPESCPETSSRARPKWPGFKCRTTACARRAAARGSASRRTRGDRHAAQPTRWNETRSSRPWRSSSSPASAH